MPHDYEQNFLWSQISPFTILYTEAIIWNYAYSKKNNRVQPLINVHKANGYLYRYIVIFYKIRRDAK